MVDGVKLSMKGPKVQPSSVRRWIKWLTTPKAPIYDPLVATSVFYLVMFFILVHGCGCANPTISDWWRSAGIPLASSHEPSYSDGELTQMYDKALKNFDLGDLIGGSIYLVFADIIGSPLTLAMAGVTLCFSYTVYIFPYGSYGDLMLNISTIIQGSILANICITTFQVAFQPGCRQLTPGLRFMLLNGSIDLGTFLTVFFQFLTRRDIPTQLIGAAMATSAGLVAIFALFLLPEDVRRSQKALKSFSLEGSDGMLLCSTPFGTTGAMACCSSRGVKTGWTQENLLEDLKEPLTSPSSHSGSRSCEGTKELGRPGGTYLKEISAPVVWTVLIAWMASSATKVLLNGSAIETAVARQYGMDSLARQFLQNFAWTGFISAIAFGAVADYSFGLAFFLFVTCLGTFSLLCFAFESWYTVFPGLITFYLFRGSLHGSLFFIMSQLVWDIAYDGRVIATCCLTTGLLMKFFVNLFVIDMTFIPHEVFPYNKDYRPVLKLLCIVMIPMFTMTIYWWRVLIPQRMDQKRRYESDLASESKGHGI